jgi:hypothetical protein
MIKKIFTTACFGALLFSGGAIAAECQPEGAYEQFAFRPPEGFVEVRPRRSSHGITYVFREDKLETEAAGVIQLIFNYTQDDFSLLKPEQQEEVKELYLKRYMGSFEGRRGEFKKSEITNESFGNGAYKKMSWSGKAGKEDMKGVMYVTVINSVVTVVNLQMPSPGVEALEKTVFDCLGTLKLTLD